MSDRQSVFFFCSSGHHYTKTIIGLLIWDILIVKKKLLVVTLTCKFNWASSILPHNPNWLAPSDMDTPSLKGVWETVLRWVVVCTAWGFDYLKEEGENGYWGQLAALPKLIWSPSFIHSTNIY